MLQRFSSKYTFIEIYNSGILLFKVLNFGLYLEPPLFIFMFFYRINKFYRFDPLRLYLVDAVNFSEQGRIDSVITEVSVE